LAGYELATPEGEEVNVFAIAPVAKGLPIVFKLQEPGRRVVAGARLSAWERAKRRELGLAVGDWANGEASSSTVSHCPNDDDSDTD
jgi:hypothetical protein